MMRVCFPIYFVLSLLCCACRVSEDTILKPVFLSQEEIDYLKEDLDEKDKIYDRDVCMTRLVTNGRHYHSDLDSGVVVHETRASIEYAVALLYTREEASIQRAIDIIKAILPLQETDPTKPYCGVWPYYPEDPLQGRKAPVDYNWADFMAVPLLEILINFRDCIDTTLQEQIEEALKLAAYASMRRNVQGDYTNMCIMGIYVCYVVGDLLELPDMKTYAKNKLRYFYEYTELNKGFTEYNSPTYTVVAMDELLRLKRTIVNSEDKKMIDALYERCWDVIARHYHQPSGQWCGPNLRTYNDLLTPDLKRLFYNASDGAIELPGEYSRIPNVIVPHELPKSFLPLFLQQQLPKMEVDTFQVGVLQPIVKKIYNGHMVEAKDVVGTLYATDKFAVSSVNQGYMWNQCRPLTAYWGTQDNPVYFRVRFLHDMYDFAAMHIKSVQDSTMILSVLNVAFDGGDKHPSIGKIQNGTIHAEDIRLRFEIGGDISHVRFEMDTLHNAVVCYSGEVVCRMELPYVGWDGHKGRWSLGKEGGKMYADYIIYCGGMHDFDFLNTNEAVIGLAITISGNGLPDRRVTQTDSDDNWLTLQSGKMYLRALKKPADEFRIKNDYIMKKTE